MVDIPKITTLFALVKFNPVPPASVEIRKINIFGSLLNLSIIGIPKRIISVLSIVLRYRMNSDLIRSVCFVDPSNLQKL